MGEPGMSMPVRSVAPERNGVDEGQAPTQIPQLAHSSASTTAICRAMRRFGCGSIVTAA